MSDDLGELLQQALSDIEDAGGRERHLLRETIGQTTYDKLISKAKGADLVDRWISTTGKAKAPATRALAVQIARVADKPELVKRIEREVGDAFDGDMPESNHVSGKRSHPPTRDKKAAQKGQRQSPDFAELARSSDIRKYVKARQAAGKEDTL